MPQSFYEAVWIFMIYAFLGWIGEVAYAALEDGKFVNRGFLNGPVCPIYGFGMILVILVLWPLKNNIFLLFAGSFLLTTALEYVTGFVLEKFFKNKWWDYSDLPFNVNGYICLKFSVLWGFAASFVIGAIHPIIYAVISGTPFSTGLVLLTVFVAVFTADIVITVTAVMKLPRRLKAIEDTERALTAISEKLGENIYGKTVIVADKGNEFVEENRERLQKLKAEYEERIAEYRKLTENLNFVHRRIFKAFPKLASGKDKLVERVKKIKEQIRNDKNEKDTM